MLEEKNFLEELEDVFEGPELDTAALLRRYRDYLKRLKAKGLNPWKDQPRRVDLHVTEAVGHRSYEIRVADPLSAR